MRQLSEEEFKKTFGSAMVPILFDDNLLAYKIDSIDIILLDPESAYRNDMETSEHHLVKTDSENIFLVFVKKIVGNKLNYFFLDLNKEYGLT